ncbi:MAG: hypothetical protein Q8J64_00655 [Thermodesulfovibrionales bacterium]|nr:hypothetical protein [Thermodesulfovibrionales bacterium]
MKLEELKDYVLPPGPVLGLTLIGILLLGAVIYYRAVRIQRFLEPAVAISQPRVEFAGNIRLLLQKEFGEKAVRGVMFTTDSILVEKSLLKDANSSSIILKKLGRIFLSMLNDPQMKNYINLILINTRPPLSQNHESNRAARLKMQDTSKQILNALYDEEPELENYDIYFAATAVTIDAETGKADWVEFKIIPSEQLHIDVLMKLEKYIR